jgi:aryl-alcohol dehydrogenase-like predicted oxidoreductase
LGTAAKLKYRFEGDLKAAVATALRFTLSVPAVHTAIVGTAKPGRFSENAAVLKSGPLPKEVFDRFRERWRATARASWIGQT